MAIETALAKASLTRVDERDPYKLFHKYPRARLQIELTPVLQLGGFYSSTAIALDRPRRR